MNNLINRIFTIGEVADGLLFQNKRDKKASVSKKTKIYNNDHNYNAYLSELMFKDIMEFNSISCESGDTGEEVKADEYDFRTIIDDKQIDWDVKSQDGEYKAVLIGEDQRQKAIDNKTLLAWFRIMDDKGKLLGICNPKKLQFKGKINDGVKLYEIDVDSLVDLFSLIKR